MVRICFVYIQSTPSKRRLIRDFKRLSSDPPGGISGAPCADNLLVWNAVIFGPSDTPFEDGTFKLLLTFDESYPNKPPSVKFLSKMFHPNVYANGELCLDILQNRWSPTYDVAAILTSIQSLLHDPNPNRYVSCHLTKVPQMPKQHRYIASSYQNDPIRSLLELILFIFAVRTILQNRTRARGTSHFIQFSEDVSTCELTR